MYHGLTFSAENGPGLTFSCGTDGDLIRMNGLPPYGTDGDLIREVGIGLDIFSMAHMVT
jgi:hypothetical protein